MTIRAVLIFTFTALLSACTAPAARKMNALSIGMTKAEVISIMGTPDSTAAKEGVDYMNYRLATSALDFDRSDTSDYFVRFVNGKADAFGHRGDFERVEVRVKQHQD